ncbi:MAG: hypothetical protein AB9897_04455 [Anaerolineaceae bacterium]
MRAKLPRWSLDLIVSLLFALGLGAIFAVLSVGAHLQSGLAFVPLFWICIFILIRVWRSFGSSKTLAILLTVTFLVRLGTAVFISLGLPAWGYDTPVNKAGFLYSDAYTRDQQAFQLASSKESLMTAFNSDGKTDQYGGLLFLSAAVYRLLSPDADRPLLISLLAAFVMTLGLAFLWAGIQKRWPLKIAATACWVYALFPDSILLGSSQMREPFLIGLACIALWAVLSWQETPIKSAIVATLSLGVACAFSIPAGGIVAIVLAAVVILEWALSQKKTSARWIGFGFLIALALAALVGGWLWLKSTLYYDSYTTLQGSGWVQELMRKYGERWMIPFTSIYGLTQPVLPAAITDEALPIWKTIAILRGLGWYSHLPFLLFGFFSAFKAQKTESKWLLVLFNLVFLVWVFVSSVRAGGDQWDNPRYRYILLPFMVILIAWSLDHFHRTRSPWFWRWVAVIAAFFLVFMNMYFNRYINIGTQLPFVVAVGLVGVITVLILVSGWLWDLRKRLTNKVKN